LYTILRVWQLNFKSVIYLDKNTLVKGSLRNLFELVTHRNGQLPVYDFAATGDVWPYNLDSKNFNSDFFVLRPSLDMFEKFFNENFFYYGGLFMFKCRIRPTIFLK
jgi:alpha-N-acetylglucosamine transferase